MKEEFLKIERLVSDIIEPALKEEANNNLESLHQLLNTTRSMSFLELEEWSSSLENKTRRCFLIVSGKMALQAMNDKKIAYCGSALMLLSIENFRYDTRENILRLSLIWESSRFLKKKFIDLVEEIEPISTKRSMHYFLEFEDRPKHLKSINTMGFELEKEGGKFKLTEKKPPWAK